MRASALRQSLELAGEAQDGLAWFERGGETATERGSARHDLLDGTWAGQQRHLARQAVERNGIQAERRAHSAHCLPCAQADMDPKAQRAERRQTLGRSFCTGESL